MIEVFDKKYKAISNLYVTNYDSKTYIYPSPFYVHATIENETRNLKNRLEVKVDTYNASILTLDYYFDLFFYLFSFEYKIDTILIRNCIKEDTNQDINGYKGSFRFLNNDILLNLGNTELYDKYNKIQASV